MIAPGTRATSSASASSKRRTRTSAAPLSQHGGAHTATISPRMKGWTWQKSRCSPGFSMTTSTPALTVSMWALALSRSEAIEHVG
jgi:hypothetical protein